MNLAEWTDTAGPEGGDEYLSLPRGWALDRRSGEDRARGTGVAAHATMAVAAPRGQYAASVPNTPASSPAPPSPPPTGEWGGGTANAVAAPLSPGAVPPPPGESAPAVTPVAPPPGESAAPAAPPPGDSAAVTTPFMDMGGGAFTEDAFSAPPPPDFGPPPPPPQSAPSPGTGVGPHRASATKHPLVSAALVVGALKLLTFFL